MTCLVDQTELLPNEVQYFFKLSSCTLVKLLSIKINGVASIYAVLRNNHHIYIVFNNIYRLEYYQ